VTLQWQAQPGQSYQIQFKTDLGAQDWLDLAGEVVATDCVASARNSIQPGATQCFYRVVKR
jgi:hypothetical protein